MSMAADALITLIDMFRGERRYNRELTNAALLAINRAVVATRTYEALVSPDGMQLNQSLRNREEEIRIGGLWQEASVATRNVSQDFAVILYDKSLYWMTNFSYTAEEVLARKIDWDSIDRLTLELIQKKA